MKLKHIVTLLLVIAISCTIFVGCKDDEEPEAPLSLIDTAQLANVPDGQLYIEWLANYKSDKPTVIYVHGEMKGCYDKKASLLLDTESYVMKDTSDTNKAYNVDDSSYVATYENGRDLSTFWKRMGYNVGIFHYEAFADDELGTLTKKIFSKADMRYKKTADSYEANAIPSCSLTEILAARIAEAIPDDASNSLRLVGNGIGADLALSATDYLYTLYKNGSVTARNLPERLAFVDPYLTAEKMPSGFNWREMNTDDGLLSMINDMMKHTTDMGLVAEMVESVEIGSETIKSETEGEDDKVVETLTYAYNTAFSDMQKAIKNQIIENTAYLLLREQYSSSFTAAYKEQNRAGVDWYLASVNGSDFSSAGYPTTTSTSNRYTSSYSNWGPYDTRPMLNDYSRSKASYYAGNSYSVSAWTPSSWTRGLRGIRFAMQKAKSTTSSTTTEKDAHGNTIYQYEAYLLARFAVENYQVATNLSKTLIGGYVFADANEDRIFNEGIGAGIAGVTVNGQLSKKTTSSNVSLFNKNITTDSDGFYMFEIDNDDKGNQIICNGTSTSASGENVITLLITVYPPSRQYGFETAAGTTYHVADLMKNHFNVNTVSPMVTKYSVNALQIRNCALTLAK